MSKIMYGGIAYGSAVDKDYGWTDLTGTLQAGETTLTIQHEIITPDVTITPHSDPYGVNPKDMVVTNGQVVLTFNAQPIDVGIMVRVSKTQDAPVLFTKVSLCTNSEDTGNLIAFPTTSPYASDCCWISLKRVYNIYKIDNYNTKIVFDNKEEIIVPCSFRSVENQLSRASRLDLVLKNRKNS